MVRPPHDDASSDAGPRAAPRPPSPLPAGTTQHRAEGAARPPVRCSVLTVSDSRTEADDVSGQLMQRLLRDGGHAVAGYRLLRNDEAAVRAHVADELARGDVDAVLCTGGTGLGSRDRTVEAVRPLLEKELPGFGELFRMLSYQEQVVPAAMLSRALAGGAGGKLVVALPGSSAAVELALTRLLLPELRHLLRELSR